MNEIHEMDNGDILNYGSYTVLRVPGGWIYTFYSESGTGGYDMSSCFVPYSLEFQEQPK